MRIYIISGGDGASGEKIARTALAQFQDVDVSVVVTPWARDSDDLRSVVDQVAADGGTGCTIPTGR